MFVSSPLLDLIGTTIFTPPINCTFHTVYVDSNSCFIFISIRPRLQQRAVLNTLLPSSGEHLNLPTLTSSTAETAKITHLHESYFISEPLNLYADVLAKYLFVRLNIMLDSKMHNTLINLLSTFEVPV